MRVFLKEIISKAKEAGWKFAPTNNGHWKFFSTDGKTIITVSGTPSDYRAEYKIRSLFKRAGVII